MKKALKIILVLIVTFSFLLVPSAFIYQDFLQGILHKVLNIRVKSSFSGGDVEFGFRDAYGDNRGSGSLSLPLNPIFGENKDNLFDLISLDIHKPQLETDWSSHGYYWQFSYGLKEICGMEVISHYFGFRDSRDRNYPESVETFPKRSEKVSFSPDFPWMYKVQIDTYRKKAELFDAAETSLGEVTLLVDSGFNRYIVRIPLEIKEIRRVLGDMDSYHYLMVGIYNSMAPGNYNPVQEKRSIHYGGGAKSDTTPRIYDYLAPKDFSLDDLESGKLKPLLAFKEFKEEINRRVNPEDLYKIIEKNRPQSQDERLSRNEIEDKLATDKNNPELLSALAAQIASEGGLANSTKEAMELVYQAYEIFDLAEENIKNDSDRLALSINRGYVSMAVPESVFKKSKTGGDDFVFAAEYYRANNLDNFTVAEYYLNAYSCYKEAQMGHLAETYLYLAIDFLGIN